jgi:hypothetical protein
LLGRPETALQGRSSQVLGRPIGSGIVYERTIGYRPLRHQRSGGWIGEEECNYVGADSRRYRSDGLDPRTHPHIVHNGAVSEISSIGDLFAYLWNGMKARRRLRRRIEHKSSVLPIQRAQNLIFKLPQN